MLNNIGKKKNYSKSISIIYYDWREICFWYETLTDIFDEIARVGKCVMATVMVYLLQQIIYKEFQ